MAPTRKYSRRKLKTSRRRRQRGGEDVLMPTTTGVATTTTPRLGKQIILSCTLGEDNKVVASPLVGITVSPPTATNTLTFSSTAPVTDISFKGPSGPVIPRYLGVGAGIIIQSGVTAIVPKGFTAVRALTPTQKRLNSSSPLNGMIKISNLNTANLGLSAKNRSFTITLTTL